MARNNFDVAVSGIRQLTDRIREYRLTSVNGHPLPEYGPGAHVALYSGSKERGLIVRHYSLIGGSETEDDPRHTLRIAVQLEDHARGSAHIHQTFAVGTRLQVGPPVNDFPLDRRQNGHTLLIAGGIGVTPIFSMARSLSRRKRPFSVFYAGRHREAMAYHDELATLAGESCRFHYSDVAGHPDLASLLGPQPTGTLAYVCGPQNMISATKDAASRLGWPADHIRSERFGAVGANQPSAFDVKLLRSGQTIHVGSDSSILDVLNASGIPVLWDCRRGECGLCPLPVVSTNGPLQHHDHYLSPEEKASGQTLCICVSRTCGSELVLDA